MFLNLPHFLEYENPKSVDFQKLHSFRIFKSIVNVREGEMQTMKLLSDFAEAISSLVISIIVMIRSNNVIRVYSRARGVCVVEQ